MARENQNNKHRPPVTTESWLMALGLCLWEPPLAHAAGCADWVARAVSLQGTVEARTDPDSPWQPVVPEQTFCGGETIRVLSRSRAALVLKQDATDLRIDQDSTLTLPTPPAQASRWLRLIRGAIHFLSRTPTGLRVRAPFVNAHIEGTEFLVQTTLAESRVLLFSGKVLVDNAQGRLTLEPGQQAAAGPGQPPRRYLMVRPADAVAWALYYPPLVDEPGGVAGRRWPQALQGALRLRRLGRAAEALAALDRVPEPQRGAEYRELRAALLLGLGRSDEAEPLLDRSLSEDPRDAGALALKALVALVHGDKAEALRLAQEATHRAADRALPWAALSYVQQGRFQLDEALASLHRAQRLAPQDALILARLAELELSLGNREAALEHARKAAAIAPRLARSQTVLGYAQLAGLDAAAAREAFTAAIRLDGNDPLPRLGLGLARIREGDLSQGVVDIELAAVLDPGNSLVRSYLGKAYYEQKREKPAREQYRRAQGLDPLDPTPWFYSAIQNHAGNRPVAAIRDLQRAVELNGNRAVVRSRQLMDTDLAARGAALGRIYREAGFERRGQLEAWRALAADPTDPTAHRLLSDSYFLLPRHQVARQSELLQSLLLQPLNATPLQPQLTESELIFLNGLGPSAPSFNEFNPLFQRNRFGLLASGLIAGHDTLADEAVHWGNWGRLSYSLGQLHYESHGTRPNNDYRLDSQLAFGQFQITPDLTLQAEYKHRESVAGDMDQWYNGYFDPYFRSSWEAHSYRAGLRYGVTRQDSLIASLIHTDLTRRPVQVPCFDCTTTPIYSAESQWIHQGRRWSLTLGGGHYERRHPNEFIHANLYAYLNGRLLPNATWILGVSRNAIEAPSSGDFDFVNPKGGVIWEIGADTIARAAVFRATARDLVNSQTIEPTQVAGFNQFFDDPGGTRSDSYALALDHKFGRTLFAGMEASFRELETPISLDENTRYDQRLNEQLYRGYIHYAPTDDWTMSLDFYAEYFDVPGEVSLLTPYSNSETLFIPLRLNGFLPNGAFAKARLGFVRQVIDRREDTASEGFILDLAAGYRLPRRLGIVEAGIQNALDSRIQLQGYQARSAPDFFSAPKSLPIAPELNLYLKFTVALF